MSELDYLLYADHILNILSFVTALCILYGAFIIYSKTELPGRKLLFYATGIALLYYLFDQSFDYIEWPAVADGIYLYTKPVVSSVTIFMFGAGFLRLCIHLVKTKIIINQSQ